MFLVWRETRKKKKHVCTGRTWKLHTEIPQARKQSYDLPTERQQLSPLTVPPYKDFIYLLFKCHLSKQIPIKLPIWIFKRAYSDYQDCFSCFLIILCFVILCLTIAPQKWFSARNKQTANITPPCMSIWTDEDILLSLNPFSVAACLPQLFSKPRCLCTD